MKNALIRRERLLHMHPPAGWFGDPIPFYWEGIWHLFYLRDQQHHALPGGRHTWGHLSSRDLVEWMEEPLAIPLGVEGEVDSASCGTGGIIAGPDGTFHLYYLGRFISTNGEKREALCHATSRDLRVWAKDRANPISRPDPRHYNLGDWRDGFPFWNAEAGEYWMIVTASLRDAPISRRGCLVALRSTDLWHWSLAERPFWAPHLDVYHECPDLFFEAGWWYLIYSVVGDPTNVGTLYRRSRSLAGPWESPPVCSFDGPLLYAAKTASDGARRLLFGWVPTRLGDHDAGTVQWGGHSTMREITRDAEGLLWARCPREVLALGVARPRPSVQPRLGEWVVDEISVSVANPAGFAYATIDGLPSGYSIHCRFRSAKSVDRFGLLFRTGPDLRAGYRLTVEPGREQLSLAPFGVSSLAGQGGLIRQFPAARARAIDAAEIGSAGIDVVAIVVGSLIEVFVDERIALVGRFYDHRGDSLALFVEDGGGSFEDVTIRELPPED